MTAIIYRRAAFGRIVYGAQVLPFAGAHFGAGLWGARGIVGEEGGDYEVGLLDEKPGEFVEPDFFACVGWWAGEDACGFGGDGLGGRGAVGVMVVEGFEVFG